MSVPKDPEAERLVALGQIFDKLMQSLRGVEQGYLTPIDNGGARTPRDVRNSALLSLDCLQDAFADAWDHLNDADKFEGFGAPWPLIVLREEISSVNGGFSSSALTTDSANKRSGNKQSRLRVHERALAVTILNALTSRFNMSQDIAAEKIATVFNEMGVMASGSPKARSKRNISYKTIIEWSYKFGKTNSKESRFKEMQEAHSIERVIEEVCNIVFDIRTTNQLSRQTLLGTRFGELSYEYRVGPNFHLLREAKADGLLGWLKDYLRGTSYSVPEKAPIE